MKTMIAVGGAPSSGSTLLADLLDSAPGVCCGPELYIFSDPSAYGFDEAFRNKAGARIPYQPRAIYAGPRAFFDEKCLADFGLDIGELKHLIERSGSLWSFADSLRQRMAEKRQQEIDIFTEKTPININEAERFCETFPGGLFVHIVRDLRTNVPSLMKRGFCIYEAILIWVVQNWSGRSARDMPNYTMVRYEDLINNPFEEVAKLVAKAGGQVRADEIEEGLSKNNYRAGVPRVSSWGVPHFEGRIVRKEGGDCLEPAVCRGLSELACVALNSHSGSIAEPCSMPMAAMMAEFGYELLSSEEGGGEIFSLNAIKREYYEGSRNVFRQRCYALDYYDISPTGEKYPIGGADESEGGLRILCGVASDAAQFEALVQGLRRLGHGAELNPWVCDSGKDERVSWRWMKRGDGSGGSVKSMANVGSCYDIVHLDARLLISEWGDLELEALLDLMYLKSIGLKIFVSFYGWEMRVESVFERKNPHSEGLCESGKAALFGDLPRRTKFRMRQFVEAICDGILVSNLEMKEYVGHPSIVVRRAVLDSGIHDPFSEHRPIPVIGCYRSGVDQYGESCVEGAVKQLTNDGIKCKLRYIDGEDRAKVEREIRVVDIFIGQLNIGDYGEMEVEAFSLGKPVICFIRDDFAYYYGESLPIANANPDTVGEVLRDLMDSPRKRIEMGEAARKFFKENHEAGVVAKEVLNLYKISEKPISEVDWFRCARILESEFDGFLEARIGMRAARMRDLRTLWGNVVDRVKSRCWRH